MPKIEFQGKTYNNEYEMPHDIRQAYHQEKERRAGGNKQSEKPLTESVDMSPEVKAIYERAMRNVEEKLPSSRPTKDMPDTDDIYRQSAPEDMKHLPSDESIYRPSQPLIDPAKPAIEPESGFLTNRFVSSIVWALILGGLVFLVMQFLL
jgi:hypothetical protein